LTQNAAFFVDGGERAQNFLGGEVSCRQYFEATEKKTLSKGEKFEEVSRLRRGNVEIKRRVDIPFGKDL